MDLPDHRIRDLFLELVKLDSWQERLTRLDESCGDDIESRSRVLDLLRAHEGTRAMLAQVPAIDESSSPDADRDAPRPAVHPAEGSGSRMGGNGAAAVRDGGTARAADTSRSDDGHREHAGNDASAVQRDSSHDRLCHVAWYAVRDPIGQGGMGRVHRAYDSCLNREVAIKVVDHPSDGETPLWRRFLSEALITAQLQHPGIPPVHGLGTDPQGRPFLVMKLVAGETLAALLRKRSDVREGRGRFVAIFEQVCHAVGYAHDHGVIHRDLKPSNIMVGEHGEVQVMDWGLAKVLSPSAAEPSPSAEVDAPATREELESAETVSLPSDLPIDTPAALDSATRTGSVLGTPRYMAPEQAGGEVRKLDPRCDVFGLGAILCEILTGKPPYTGSDPHEVLLKAVRGELQDAYARLDACGAEPELVALCKRCLSFDRSDRPANGRAVAEEVERIRQRAEERARAAELERAEAAVREAEQRKRRRVLTAALAAVLVILSAGVVGTSVGFIRAERAARSARDAQARAEAERDAKARALQAERAARAKENLARQRTLAALRLMTDDLVENVLASRSTLTLQNKRFLRTVLKHYEAFAEIADDDLQQRAVRADGLQRIALLQYHLGDLQEAERSYRMAIENWQTLIGTTQENREYRRSLARGLKGLATVLRHMDRFDEAEAALQQALQVAEELAEPTPEDTQAKELLGFVRAELGLLWRAMDRHAEAEKQLRECIAIFEQLAAIDPQRVHYVRMIAGQSCNLGHVLGEQDRLEEAARCFQRGIDLYGPLLERFPGNVDVRNNLAAAYHNLAAVYRRQDRHEQAITTYRRALELRRRVANQVPGRPSARHDLADTLLGLGWSCLPLKRFDEALGYFLEADEHNRAALKMSPRHPEYRGARRTCLASVAYAQTYRLQPKEALQAARTLRDLGYDAAEDAWRASRTLARCMHIVRSLDALPPDERDRQAAFYTEHALKMLRQAVTAGFRDVERLEKSTRFAPLRSHPEFQRLLAEMKSTP